MLVLPDPPVVLPPFSNKKVPVVPGITIAKIA
jgi:hypothetical protein